MRLMFRCAFSGKKLAEVNEGSRALRRAAQNGKAPAYWNESARMWSLATGPTTETVRLVVLA